jgi:hypothetical protein
MHRTVMAVFIWSNERIVKCWMSNIEIPCHSNDYLRLQHYFQIAIFCSRLFQRIHGKQLIIHNYIIACPLIRHVTDYQFS